MKQFLVNVVVKLWVIMPHSVKVWAFLNDGIDPHDYNCTECQCKEPCKDCDK